MRARDLAAPFPTVGLDTSALDAARLLAASDLPGLIVVDRHGHPTTVLSILAHSSTDVLVAHTFDDDHLPAWRDRIHKARSRLQRTRTVPAPDEAETGPTGV